MSRKSSVSNIPWGKEVAGLTIKTLFCAIGYTLVAFGGGLGDCFAEPGRWIWFRFTGEEGGHFLDTIMWVVGYFIACGPALWRIITSGFMSLFNPESYVVITTYSDGSKESDGGMESMGFSFFNLVIGLSIGAVAALILTPIQILIKWGSCIAKCFVRKDRAPFYTVIPIFLIFCVWFVAAPLVSIQMFPFFNPDRYNPELMLETITEARNNLYTNSFNYTAKVSTANKKDWSRYDANISYNRAANTFTVEVVPRLAYGHKRSYMKYFDRGKNKVLPGTYTFRDNELIDSKTDANKTMTEAGINEIISLFPDTLLDRIERLITSESVRDTLWGKVRTSDYDLTGDRYSHLKKELPSATRQISFYHWPWLRDRQSTSISCFEVGGRLRLYDLMSPAENNKWFSTDIFKYN